MEETPIANIYWPIYAIFSTIYKGLVYSNQYRQRPRISHFLFEERNYIYFLSKSIKYLPISGRSFHFLLILRNWIVAILGQNRHLVFSGFNLLFEEYYDLVGYTIVIHHALKQQHKLDTFCALTKQADNQTILGDAEN